jgi:hypothetical protein
MKPKLRSLPTPGQEAPPRAAEPAPLLTREEIKRTIDAWYAPSLRESEIDALASAYCRSPARRVMPLIGWLIAHGVGSFSRPS